MDCKNFDPDFEKALDKVAWTVSRHRNYARRRAANLLEYCRRKNLPLDDVVVEEHCDFRWVERRARTPRERQAQIIGYTNSTRRAYPIEVYWVMPKE